MHAKLVIPALVSLAIAGLAGGAAAQPEIAGAGASSKQEDCVFVNGVRRTPGGDRYRADPSETCLQLYYPQVSDSLRYNPDATETAERHEAREQRRPIRQGS